MLFALALDVAAPVAPVLAAGPVIDSIVIKLRDGALADPAGSLTNDEQAALFDEVQTPFAHVGYTRDGALRLQLLNPLPLDAARAAVNRARLMPQVLYANIVPLAPAAGASASSTPTAAPAQPPVRRLIVKFRDAATSAAAHRNEALAKPQLDRLSALASRPLGHERAMSGGAYVVRLFQALPVDQARLVAAHMATDPAIEYAEPDLLMQPLLAPNDTRYPEQWHYLTPSVVPGGANLPPAWDLTTGSLGIVVAVLDTGHLPLHPDLAGRFVGGYDMISDCAVANDGQPGPCTWTGNNPNQTPNMTSRDNDASDPGDWVTSAEIAGSSTVPPYHWFEDCVADTSSFHGTHVAGTIGAATGNSTGVAGINWVSKILPVRVLGKCGGYTSDIVDAIRWSVGMPIANVPDNPNPARVLNMSFGGGGACGTASQSAINDALAHNAVAVVAAGNSNVDASQSTPANCSGVITVGATGRAGQRAYYSNFGALVEISSPGGSANDGESGVLSTLNDGTTSPSSSGYNYVYYQGTSMATPHVSGIVSLMLSRNPALTPSQVLSKIQTTARTFPTGTVRDCTTALCGAGIIDAGAAVLAAGGVALPSSTMTSLVGAPSPAMAGAVVTFTATVAGSNPTGSVSFTENNVALANCSAVALTGTGNSRTAVCQVSSLSVGTHSIVVSYGGDAGNAASTSAPFSQVIDPAPAGATNVALASAGAVASASSTYNTAYPVSAVNNNERKGAGWANGGGWNDATAGSYPDWVQITFNGSKTIDRVVVYTQQDNYSNPVEPTDNLTFAQWGVIDFTVQGWNGAAWVVLGTVTGNNLVKRTVTFSAYTTDRIRVHITAASPNTSYPYSRLTEIEAWTSTTVATLADGVAGVLEKVITDPVKLPRIDGLAFDRFGNLFGVLEIVNSGGGVVAIDKVTAAVTPIALNIPGACRLDVHPNGDLYVSSELPIQIVNGVPIQFGGLYRVAITYDGANKPVSGAASKLATVLDSPEGIQPLRVDGAYGSAGSMLIAEDNVGGRIVRVSADGSGLFELVGTAANLQKPEGLAFGDFNGALSPALYAAEKAGGRIMKIGFDGSVTTFGNPAAIGGLNGPDNIAFGPDGYLYVGEKYGGRIIRVAANGTHSVFALGFDNIEGVAFDPLNGDLYIGEIEKSMLWRVRN